MVQSAQEIGKELIDKLIEGKMDSQPAVKFHIDRAIMTGNYATLIEFLNKHPVIMAQAESNIALINHQKRLNPFQPYPTRDEAKESLSGPLKLGFVNQFDDKFGFEFNVLCKPLINLGRPDSGKSQLLKYILFQCLVKKPDFNLLIPDLKREYRHLATLSKNLKILTKEKIKINPLEVPYWSDPDTYLFALAETFISENYLAGTSLNHLIDTIKFIYKKRGIYDGTINYPNLIDLYKFISYQYTKTKSHRFGDILLWLRNRILPYFLVPNFNCQFGIPFDTWRTENLILEMDKGFTDNMYDFVVAHILHLLYMYNKEMNLTGRLRHLFNIDEARILFQPYRNKSDFGESVINKDITKTRVYGIGCLVSSQETISINDILRSLSFIKIAFPLTDESDLKFIQNSWGLTEEQKNHFFELPPQTRAIVRYAGFKKPFLLQVPTFRIKKELTDEQVNERMKDFWDRLESEAKKPKTPKPIELTTSIYETNEIISDIPPPCVALLFYISRYPFTKASELKNTPGFKSVAEANKALEWLENNGFVKTEEYRASKTKKSKYSVLQEKAFTYLGIEGHPGKGDFEHKLYQHIIFEKLSQEGSEAKIEGRMEDSKKLIDVLVASKETGFVAYEITLHFENLAKNIGDDITEGVSKVVVVTRDKEDLEKAKKMVEEDPAVAKYQEKIIFETINAFFS